MTTISFPPIGKPAVHITVERGLKPIDQYDATLRTHALMSTLHMMLTTQRSHGSMGEMYAFSELVAMHSHRNFHVDAAGNLHVEIGKTRTLFTSHTDTCHSNRGNEPNMVYIDHEANGDVVWRAGPGHCLGADDGAGVALMCGMIDHGVPGYYIFFRGEERGGIGSSWLADNMPEFLKRFDRAVAFDRAGYSDVITHQGRGRCCSDAFGQALADALTTEDFTLAFSPDNTGVYTDTAEFIDIVPECTNLSVGYRSQHGDGEWQNVSFLLRLFDRLLDVKWEDLPTVRDPAVREPLFTNTYSFSTYTTDMVESKDSVVCSEDAAILFDAVDSAMMGGSIDTLKRVVSEIVYPDDPPMVYRLMSRHLRAEDIEDAFNDLCQGVDPLEVADFLYDCCSSA